MDVILRVGEDARVLGPRRPLDALFETIACRLEPDGRATRYPVVSFDLRYGRLTADRAAMAILELDEIQTGLCALPATKVLWTGSAPAWNGAASAFEALSAPDGRPLIEHLRYGAGRCVATGKVLDIRAPEMVKRDVWLTVCVVLGGAAWTLFGFLLIPRWLVSPLGSSDERPTGIPVWTFGFLIFVFGIWLLIATLLPGVRLWFLRRQWATIVVALLVMVGWMSFSIVR